MRAPFLDRYRRRRRERELYVPPGAKGIVVMPSPVRPVTLEDLPPLPDVSDAPAHLAQLTPAEAEAQISFTWGPGSDWGPHSRFFADYDEYVAARKSGTAKLRAIANG